MLTINHSAFNFRNNFLSFRVNFLYLIFCLLILFEAMINAEINMIFNCTQKIENISTPANMRIMYAEVTGAAGGKVAGSPGYGARVQS